MCVCATAPRDARNAMICRLMNLFRCSMTRSLTCAASLCRPSCLEVLATVDSTRASEATIVLENEMKL